MCTSWHLLAKRFSVLLFDRLTKFLCMLFFYVTLLWRKNLHFSIEIQKETRKKDNTNSYISDNDTTTTTENFGKFLWVFVIRCVNNLEKLLMHITKHWEDSYSSDSFVLQLLHLTTTDFFQVIYGISSFVWSKTWHLFLQVRPEFDLILNWNNFIFQIHPIRLLNDNLFWLLKFFKIWRIWVTKRKRNSCRRCGTLWQETFRKCVISTTHYLTLLFARIQEYKWIWQFLMKYEKMHLLSCILTFTETSQNWKQYWKKFKISINPSYASLKIEIFSLNLLFSNSLTFISYSFLLTHSSNWSLHWMKSSRLMVNRQRTWKWRKKKLPKLPLKKQKLLSNELLMCICWIWTFANSEC